MSEHERTPTPHGQGEAADGRRTFLKLGVGAIGAGLATVVIAPALRAVLWP
jgi:menaquinol-cytochrome c reductase iron-sulfur subunit